MNFFWDRSHHGFLDQTLLYFLTRWRNMNSLAKKVLLRERSGWVFIAPFWSTNPVNWKCILKDMPWSSIDTAKLIYILLIWKSNGASRLLDQSCQITGNRHIRARAMKLNGAILSRTIKLIPNSGVGRRGQAPLCNIWFACTSQSLPSPLLS